jgi:uncharacterized protein (TIGR00251 family)
VQGGKELKNAEAVVSGVAHSGVAHSGLANSGLANSGVALRVVPNASKTEVVGRHGDALKVKVASPALEGKANAAILEFIAKTAGVPVRMAVLVAGAKSRDKVVKVEGMGAAAVRAPPP